MDTSLQQYHSVTMKNGLLYNIAIVVTQIKNNISPIFHDILAFKLYTSHNAPTTIQLHQLPQDLKALMEQQQQHGWTKLYYGCFSRPLSTYAMQTYHPQINGVRHYVAPHYHVESRLGMKQTKRCARSLMG